MRFWKINLYFETFFNEKLTLCKHSMSSAIFLLFDLFGIGLRRRCKIHQLNSCFFLMDGLRVARLGCATQSDSRKLLDLERQVLFYINKLFYTDRLQLIHNIGMVTWIN
ncbi:hypothetical protein HanIR_Chr11g0509091 [Helianthus annuus]|nr:hypothetical protein HanIR_Chr11g0509091 [Helianthus annuus]